MADDVTDDITDDVTARPHGRKDAPAAILPSEQLPAAILSSSGDVPAAILSSQELPAAILPSEALPAAMMSSEAAPSEELPAAILAPEAPPSKEAPAAILFSKDLPPEVVPAAILASEPAPSGDARADILVSGALPAAILSSETAPKEDVPAAILSSEDARAAILSPEPAPSGDAGAAILASQEAPSAILFSETAPSEDARAAILSSAEIPAAILSPEPAPSGDAGAAILASQEAPSAISSSETAPSEETPSAILSSEDARAAILSPAAIPAAPRPSGPSPWGCRRGGDEDVTAAGWRARRKHVFVLSEAGKPIYSRHGNEEALAATMGVMMALVSFIQSGGNTIRAICSEDRTLVFEHRGPLLLVSVSRTRRPPSQLRRELSFLHDQILSLLTRGGIARVFARRRGYDLRRLLSGAEAVLDRLLSGAAADGRFLLGAARCLPLPPQLRRGVSGALRRAAASVTPAPALALLAAGGRLVTAARQRAMAEGGRLVPSDLHLLLNLLGCGVGAGEVWTPVCLPRFNPDGYFYAYAAVLGGEEEEEEGEEEEEEGEGEGGGGLGDKGVTLILLSTEREAFYAAAACRRRLEETLRAQGWLGELGAAAKGGYGPSKPGAPELRHFLYKPLEGPEEMQQLPQFTSPELEEPYTNEEEQHRLFDLYHYLHGRVHSPHRPLRLLYHVAEKETLLAWVTSKFELYGCFSPLVTKAAAIGVLTKLLRWLKKEEDWLFIRYPAPYCPAPARPEGAEAEG